jgi:hypothetical protein
MVRISLVPVLTPLYLYVSTFRSMCAVPNMAVFCSSLTSCFPGMVLTYFLNDFEMVPVAPLLLLLLLLLLLHSVYLLIFLYISVPPPSQSQYTSYKHWSTHWLLPLLSLPICGRLTDGFLNLSYFFSRREKVTCSSALSETSYRKINPGYLTSRIEFSRTQRQSSLKTQ